MPPFAFGMSTARTAPGLYAPISSLARTPANANVHDTVRGNLGQRSGAPIRLSDIRCGSRLDLYVSKDGYEPKLIVLGDIRGNHDVLAVLRPLTTRLWIGTVPAGAALSFRDGTGMPVRLRGSAQTHNGAAFSNQAFLVPADWTHVFVTLE